MGQNLRIVKYRSWSVYGFILCSWRWKYWIVIISWLKSFVGPQFPTLDSFFWQFWKMIQFNAFCLCPYGWCNVSSGFSTFSLTIGILWPKFVPANDDIQVSPWVINIWLEKATGNNFFFCPRRVYKARSIVIVCILQRFYHFVGLIEVAEVMGDYFAMYHMMWPHKLHDTTTQQQLSMHFRSKEAK